MVAEAPACRAHRHDLGMRGGIVVGDVAVPAFADHFAGRINQDRADRDLVIRALGMFGQRQRTLHPGLVCRRVHHSHSIVAGGLPLMS
jgi:hypothetical protein